MDPRVESMRAVLHEAFRDRRVVLAGGPVAGSTGRVAALRALGVERCLVLGVGRGTGPLPSASDADVVQWDLPAVTDVAAALRAEEVLFRDPPPPFVEALTRFDPDGDALVLGPPFAALYELAGRSVYGGRRAEWVALEDKTVTDALFAAAAVAAPPFEIVPAERSALVAAARRLDCGAGTVWAGDAQQGFNGSTAYVHWVVDSDDAEVAIAQLTAQCARVRVAAFVEGIPCSVHGFVTDDGIAVFRPVELMVLRGAHAPRFRFAGAGTIWDPPAADRAEIRAAAGRVGAQLREQVGFRGAYTVDGILSASGWVANECNPRFGAGLQYTRAALPDLGLDLLHHAVIAGDGPDVTAAAVEDLVLSAGDATRWGAAWTATTSASWSDSASVPVVGDAAGYRLAESEETADATFSYGPGPMGGFVRCEFVAARVPAGASTAPRAVAALAFADAHCRAGIGPVRAPLSVR